ncbi:MAG: hypothetical protein KatS3mg087_1761 [Patescibacteria group bacterium]|nr:MAG: hypothetical protein KatS3mg087_1761 [Patescibacteria group bacterium]
MSTLNKETPIHPKAGQHIVPSIPDDVIRSFILLSIKKKIPTETFFVVREFLREYGRQIGDVDMKQVFNLALKTEREKNDV